MNKEQKNAKREYLERIEGQTLDECRSLLRKGLWTEGELDELARGLQKISDRTAIRRLKKENGEPLRMSCCILALVNSLEPGGMKTMKTMLTRLATYMLTFVM